MRFNSRGGSWPNTGSFLMCLTDSGTNRLFSKYTALRYGRVRVASKTEAEDQCDAKGL